MSNTNVRVKPVWRLNQGGGVPSDLGKLNMYEDGQISGLFPTKYTNNSLWVLGGGSDIIAYETTRTKVGKYGRVGCDSCNASGKELRFNFRGKLIETEINCTICNGHGHTGELIK